MGRSVSDLHSGRFGLQGLWNDLGPDRRVDRYHHAACVALSFDQRANWRIFVRRLGALLSVPVDAQQLYRLPLHVGHQL